MSTAGPDKLLSFFFRPQGRITRREYALGAGMIVAINAAVLAFLITSGDPAPGLLLVIALLGIPLTVALFVVAAKRCHDIGLPATFTLLLIVPFFGPFWLLALALIPGTGGPNAYGPTPTFQSD
jgi:uncharacterized membrane protein YhaH (DUF805 family)